MLATIAGIVRVLDAETVVVGMRPAVAITLVELGPLARRSATALNLEGPGDPVLNEPSSVAAGWLLRRMSASIGHPQNWSGPPRTSRVMDRARPGRGPSHPDTWFGSAKMRPGSARRLFASMLD